MAEPGPHAKPCEPVHRGGGLQLAGGQRLLPAPLLQTLHTAPLLLYLTAKLVGTAGTRPHLVQQALQEDAAIVLQSEVLWVVLTPPGDVAQLLVHAVDVVPLQRVECIGLLLTCTSHSFSRNGK